MNLINKNAQIICEIICSEDFKEKLDLISINYSNLKQESHIRNTILELFNKKNIENQRAFAEHPRENGRKVDLSIVSNESSGKKDIFTIEFKYNFPKDSASFRTYNEIIENDFNREVAGIRTSMFILIVAQWETEPKSKKSEHDENWEITSNLSRFVDNNGHWGKNIKKSFNDYENKEQAFAYEITPISTETLDIVTTYNFFILSREEVDYKSIKDCHVIKSTD